MSTDTKAVDVLAVLDAQARHTRQFGGSPSFQTIEQALAAIVELIEADREYDTVFAELVRIDMAGPRHNSYGTGWEPRDRAHREEVESRFSAARGRRAAALRACGGA